MKFSKLTSLTLPAILLLTGCASQEEEAGEGTLQLRTAISASVQQATRSSADLESQAMVWISNSKGLIRRYDGLANVPSEIALNSGSYIAEAWAGDSVAASFDTRYFRGSKAFDIQANQVTSVELTCRIANVVTSVNYASDVDQVLKGYTLTVSSATGSLQFEGRDDRKGYFMMSGSDSHLTYTLSGIKFDGTAYEQTGTIDDVKPATEYAVNISRSAVGDSDQGGAFFKISIDATTIDHSEEVVITLAPSIEGDDFDIAEPIVGETGKMAAHEVHIAGATALQSVKINSTVTSEVELLSASDATIKTLAGKGIDWKYAYQEADDRSSMRLTFGSIFTSALPEGESAVEITATDVAGKSTTATLQFTISDAPVVTADVNDVDIWATSATLQATILKADQTAGAGFKYRAKGSSDWKTVSATVGTTHFTAAVSGLSAATTYEYVATTSAYTSTIVKTFTTEEAAQLPNGDFETWYLSTPYLLAADSDSRFWDSGNHGSAKMSKNITTPATDIKHGGQYSACLSSQFVGMLGIGKFAAGNAFVGEYLATDGTDGILGFGRPFTSRPTSLSGYVRYVPQSVSYSSLTDMPTGSMDQGIIYIAVLDATTESYGGQSFPFVIKTKSSEQRLFDKDDARVLAYGEKVFTAATDGDGMVQFNIPLTYNRRDVKAVHILVVCSASRYGDYFTGGPSVMYIDDFQLNY
jgi:hypothetical protein